jgi:hypothetical protein
MDTGERKKIQIPDDDLISRNMSQEMTNVWCISHTKYDGKNLIF